MLDRQSGGLALDFIRANLFDRSKMIPLPFDVPGPDNDLNEKIDKYVQRAMADEEALIYAFGERWGPEKTKDKIFGFLPGNGIHDIHMNQGNVGKFRVDDGVWQDGAMLIYFPQENRWVGIFLKFQSQTWHTNDQDGHSIITDKPAPEGKEPPKLEEPENVVQIVAALVNPTGPDPKKETVILINTLPQPINLTGWAIATSSKISISSTVLLLPVPLLLLPWNQTCN